MTVLITRTYEDGLDLARCLSHEGISTALFPLSDICYYPVSLTPEQMTCYHGILLTSRHGARALATLGDATLPLFSVGDATAEAASFYKGAHHVAKGSVASLAKEIQRVFQNKKVTLLHLCGHHTHPSMKTLQSYGVIKQQCVYEARAVGYIPMDVQNLLKSHLVKSVVFFSPRSVTLFVDVMRKYAIEYSSLLAFCLSPSIAHEAKGKGFKTLWTPTALSKKNLIRGIIKETMTRG